MPSQAPMSLINKKTKYEKVSVEYFRNFLTINHFTEDEYDFIKVFILSVLLHVSDSMFIREV